MSNYYESSICHAGNHECASVACCEWNDVHSCDNQLYCGDHLGQCEGCKKHFCQRCAGPAYADLRKTDCGLLCADCRPEYGCEQ